MITRGRLAHATSPAIPSRSADSRTRRECWARVAVRNHESILRAQCQPLDQLGHRCHPAVGVNDTSGAPPRTHRAPADVDRVLYAPDRCPPTEMIFGLATVPPVRIAPTRRAGVRSAHWRSAPVRSASLRMASKIVPGRQLPEPRPQSTLGGAGVFHDLWGRVEAHCRPS